MIRDKVQSSSEYQAIASAQEGEADGGTQQSTTQSRQTSATTVGTALGPVLDLEKGDAQFWMDVAKVVLLYLIWRELSRGGL